MNRRAAPGRPAGRPWRHAACAVWWARPTRAPPLLNLLDDTERRTAARLARPADRARYITGHALVRLLLADRTGEPATRLRFDRTCPRCDSDHGKPRLTPARRGAGVAASFNLAHAGERIVVAVTDHDLDVGVDVEHVPDSSDIALGTASTEVLTARERSALELLPAGRRGHALAVWWTRKEAVLKATGAGLVVPPATVEVTAPHLAPALIGPVVHHPQRPPGFGRSAPAVAADPRATALRDLDAGPGYVGCVAVHGAHSVDVAERDAGTLLGVA